LESQIKMANLEIERYEIDLQEKQEQYAKLLTEYRDLSEAVAISFDKRMTSDVNSE
jgi:hypothetical protein